MLSVSTQEVRIPATVLEVDRRAWLELDVAALLHRLRERGKRIFDVVVSLLVLLLLSPLLLALFCLVRASGRGPVFFRQPRVGYGCQIFTMYKFRTMGPEADLQLDSLVRARGDEYFFKLKEDPRVTRVGRWLRRFSLDELPQLWNVLRGDMSLVGPRPLLIPEVKKSPLLSQHPRFWVKPGLTGLWQVSGRSNCTERERLLLDLEYAERYSPALDLVILLKTVPTVFSGHGAY